MTLKLNVGCGGAWHVEGWFGIDQRSTAEVWQRAAELQYLDVDIKEGLPFPTNSVDVIFCSHALEHFTYEEGVFVLFEMYRVLKIGAPLCLVLPDMDLYISAYVNRDAEYLTTPEIIGGTPRGNFADNFLMNFFSDPKFNNTCHKYSYNLENLSHRLETVGFAEIQRVDYHDFSYWPELNTDEFRSPIKHIERFSLCIQCRKKAFNPDYRTYPVFQEAQRYARIGIKENAVQQVNSLLILNEGLTAQNEHAHATAAHLHGEVARLFEEQERLKSVVQANTAELEQRMAEIGQLHAQLSERSGENSAIEPLLAQRASEIENLQAELAQRSAEKSAAEALLAQDAAERDQLQAELRQRSGEIAALKAEIREKRFKTERLQHEIERLRRDADKREEAIQASLAAQSEQFSRRAEELRLSNAATQNALDHVLSTQGQRNTVRERELNFWRREAQMSKAAPPGRGRRSFGAAMVERSLNYPREFQIRRVLATSGVFDTQWYATQYADVARSGLDPLTHYVRYGFSEGRDPHPLFDTDWYLQKYPEVAEAGLNPLADYLQTGAAQGRDPHPLFDTDWYMAKYPDTAAVGLNPLAEYIRSGAAGRRNPNPLFDSAWYLAQNPDVAASGVNPLVHYIMHGAGCDPHPLFHTKSYLEQNPQVASVNPLVHYLEHWSGEAGDPHPLFDTSWYLSQYPDVAASGVNPLVHYLEHGAREGRDPHPLFDTKWYLAHYGGIAINPLFDFVLRGWSEGRCPNGLFDGRWYLMQYPDVVASGSNPLIDYIRSAKTQPRNPNPIFDTAWYLAQYPDVARAGVDPLAHYLRTGWTEGRDPHPLFDTDWYMAQYPEVATARVNPLADYLQNGLAKRRNPSPEFDADWYLTQYRDIAAAGVNPLAQYIQHGRREGRSISAVVPRRGLETAHASATPLMDIVLKRSHSDRPITTHSGYFPLISVLLPTWNTPARYLREVLESVRQQTYENWELCIVDDGSTDQECQRTLGEVETRDPRIRVAFRSKNGGIAEASQQALEMARGEFVGFVDHDDALAPNALAEVVGLLREDPTIAMVYTDHAMMDEAGTLRLPALKPAWSPEFFLSTNYIVHFKVMRRSVVLEVGGFRDTIHVAQDIGLTCKLLDRNVKIQHLPKVLYYWRAHDTSVASGTSAKPAIENAAINSYNAYLNRRGIQAKVVWPNDFRRRKTGVYKLDFPRSSDKKISIVVPALEASVDLSKMMKRLRKTDFSPLPAVHIFTSEAPPSTNGSGIHVHTATTQAAFDEALERIESDILVFLSPSGITACSAWLTELLGYFLVSPEIGAVGGKILDQRLCVRSGGMLHLEHAIPISVGESDEADGSWFNNRIASNVESVSAQLMATPAHLYRTLGGIPFFEYADAAGIAYCMKLRQAGYRIVYNPWSKIVDFNPQSTTAELELKLRNTFGKDVQNDKYYHPFLSRNVPYTLA